MTSSAASDHCYTPSWCKCPDEPKCLLCKQGRCPVEPETSAATHRWHPVQNNGWWCCVCDNRCHKRRPCADHAPCVPAPKATLCGGPHAE